MTGQKGLQYKRKLAISKEKKKNLDNHISQI